MSEEVQAPHEAATASAYSKVAAVSTEGSRLTFDGDRFERAKDGTLRIYKGAELVADLPEGWGAYYPAALK